MSVRPFVLAAVFANAVEALKFTSGVTRPTVDTQREESRACDERIPNPDIAHVFDDIAIHNKWHNNESISGDGSTVDANQFRVKFLGDFIKKQNLTKIIDIPCGDANWQYTIPGVDTGACEYYGADVSSEALERARKKNANRPHMKFAAEPFDWTNDVPEVKDADHTIIMIKECIQHLPLEAGMAALRNAKRSGARYLAITNHDKELFCLKGKENNNVGYGGFYPNNMFMSPFNFPPPLGDAADFVPPDLRKGLGNLMIFDLTQCLNFAPYGDRMVPGESAKKKEGYKTSN